MKRKITLSLKYALMILAAESLSGENFQMSREARRIIKDGYRLDGCECRTFEESAAVAYDYILSHDLKKEAEENMRNIYEKETTKII